jgi:hypothetical protein
VTASVEPVTGHCPRATLTFTGIVTTNGGAGSFTYQWLQPDGSPSPFQTATVPAGTKRATVTLIFDYRGNGSTEGVAALHVTEPIDVYSSPLRVSYACP